MKDVIQQTPNDDFVLELTREFQFPREKVFASFASYEAMAVWFGPHDCKVTEGSLDFKVGGTYRLVIQGDDTYVIGGTYHKISPPEKIEFTWQWEPGNASTTEEMDVSIEFREIEKDVTELYLRQVRVPDKEVAESHVWGWTETFEKLGESLHS